MAEKLSEKDIAKIKAIFDKFDKDRDGHITKKELKEVMKNLGQRMSDEEVCKMLHDMDTDMNGTIEFDEFCKFVAMTGFEI